MRGVGIPSPSTLFPTLEGGGRGVGISTPSTLFFALGLKWVGGGVGIPTLSTLLHTLELKGGGGGWEEETFREEALFITNQA